MDFHMTSPCYSSSGGTIYHPAFVLLAVLLHFLLGLRWIHSELQILLELLLFFLNLYAILISLMFSSVLQGGWGGP